MRLKNNNNNNNNNMIYGKPQTLPISPEILKKLETLVMNNHEGNLTDVIISFISNNKLPYLYTPDKEGIHVLRSMLSQGEQFLDKFITEDDSTLSMKEDAKLMMKCPYEVLITGETGTGKELIAQSMIGSRTGAIRIVNCAGLPTELIESELFGHVQGAFTGATKSKAGMMQAAADGLMFLDEVGELPIEVQGKLLRALQEKKIRAVGSNEEKDITCKFVCATNRNLRAMVIAGTFRRDLFARISALELDIKPLAQRMCDVVPIAQSLVGGVKFLEKYQEILEAGKLDLSNNVRSLQAHVIRFNVLGRVL